MKKVLIIEDDADTLDLMEVILHEAGFAVIKAKRQVPIKEIAGINPDLVILDYLLPFGTGSEISLEIKMNPLTEHIPVILYSASTGLEQFARESRADAYIGKPFDIDNLIGVVSEMTQ